MANRVSAADVKVIIKTTLADADITKFITDANVFVNVYLSNKINNNELLVENKQTCRCQECIESQFYENGKRYLRYNIFNSDEETCGDCLLQYYDFTGKIYGYSICPAFNSKILYKQGLILEGDDVYEIHYRCKACKNATIKNKEQ